MSSRIQNASTTTYKILYGTCAYLGSRKKDIPESERGQEEG